MSVQLPPPKKTTSKPAKYLFWFFGLLLLWYVYGQINAFSTLISSAKNPAPWPKITHTYKEVFANYDTTEIKPSYTFFNKFKNPISTFFVNNGNDRIMVYKFNNTKNRKSLGQFLDIVWNGERGAQKGLYNGSYRDANMGFGDADKKVVESEKVHIDIDGIEEGSALVSDSLICYTIDINNLSGYYASSRQYDFYFEKKTRLFGQKFTVQLAFLKKDSVIYMLILSPIAFKPVSYKKNQLYNLLISDK